MQSTFRFLISATCLYLLAACASLPDDKNLQSHAESVANSSSLSSSSFLQRAKLKIQKGKSEYLNLYAPTYFEHAQVAYKEAYEAYKNKDDEEEVKTQTQLSIEYIDSGLRNKKVVKNTLKKSLKNRQVLRALKSHKHLNEDYQIVEDKLLELVRLIEQRKLDAALTQERELLKEMRTLEVKTIGFTHLSKAQAMLAKAQAQDVQKLLPKTYENTLKNLDKSRLFIRKNPRKPAAIKRHTQSSLFATQKLYYLTREAKRLQNMDESKIEGAVLYHQAQLQRINVAAKQADLSNTSFNDQSLILADKIKHKIGKSKSKPSKKITKAELDKWKRKVVLLQREVKRLHKKLKK